VYDLAIASTNFSRAIVFLFYTLKNQQRIKKKKGGLV